MGKGTMPQDYGGSQLTRPQNQNIKTIIDSNNRSKTKHEKRQNIKQSKTGNQTYVGPHTHGKNKTGTHQLAPHGLFQPNKIDLYCGD